MANFNVINAVEKEFAAPDGIRKLLLTHLKTPDKTEIYLNGLRSCIQDGRFVFKATWSWWAFFGGAFYFFYRRMMKEGVIVLCLYTLTWGTLIPYAGLIISAGCAASAKYWYSKKFLEDLEASGFPSQPREDVERKLAGYGGYEAWAVWAGVLVFIIGIIINIASFGLWATRIIGGAMWHWLF